MAADSLLRRAAQLLGCPEVSEAENWELLQSFEAGGVQGVLVCKTTRSPLEAAAGEAPAEAPAEALPVADAGAEPSAAATTELQPAGDGPAGPQPERVGDEATASSAEPAPSTSNTDGKSSLHVCMAGSMPAELQGCPAVYFARCSNASNDGASSEPQQAQEEPGVSCSLLPTGPSLSHLHLLLTHVLAPLVAGYGNADAKDGGNSDDNDGTDAAAAAEAALGQGNSRGNGNSNSRGGSVISSSGIPTDVQAELLVAVHKFAAQVASCAKHVRSEVAVQLPAADLRDVAAAARSEEAVLACERCMEEWVRAATGVLQRESAVRPAGRGPLAELEFWQARAEVYGGLLEQLSVPAVRAAQGVVEAGSLDHNLAASFRAQLSELTRLAMEARDNARFLLTLERHFRALAGGGLRGVADALHPMLNALRMIWVVSRYYGDDVHMSNLMERIAHGLQDRLDGALDMGSLFRAPAAQSLELVRTCRAIAEGWQAHYMAMREKIEASGHHARWEFSKQLLFERTNHAAEVCGELAGMVQAVDDFRQFLGPELKAVTGDTSVIDEVSVMVQAMVEPVERVGFNPLDRAAAAEWRAVRQRFARDADDIKLATRDLIDTCFRRLRSVDAAAQLLHSFQRIQAQGAMQQQMADKLAAVLEHFIREIHAVRRLFEEGRESPPLTRNMPPVAGSIKWSRGLLVRLRRTWIRLQALNNDLEALETGRRASDAMTELSKDMLRYEKSRFAAWDATVDAAVTAGLQQPLLCHQPAAPGVDSSSHPGSGQAGSDGSGGAVAINFPPALLRLMREAKYLDQMGYTVPQLAVNLALQEGQIREHFQALGSMLDRHRGATASLHSAERALLVEQLMGLKAALEPGLTRINWTSLTIPQFVAAVNKVVDQFTALVAQVQKNTALIEKTIFHITRARLVPPDAPLAGASSTAAGGDGSGGATPAASSQPGGVAAASAPANAAEQGATAGQPEPGSGEAVPGSGQEGVDDVGLDVPDLQEFVEDFEQHRQQVVEGLAARYRSVGPLLVKVEELVAGTASGKSPRLAGYYAYWERRLFSAVNSMVVSGLQALHARMQACRGGGQQEAADAESGQPSKPLFRVALSLIQSEVVVVPSTVEVAKALQRLLHNMAESAKPFVRWMDGTCIEAPEQYVYGEDAEPFVFSFFSDISQSPAVIRAMLGAQHEVQRAATGVGRVAARWHAFGVLWRGDRDASLAKLRTRKPNVAAAEERMAQYHRVGEEAWAAGGDQDTHFIRVRCAPLAAAVRDEAQAWVRGIAQVLAEGDAEQLGALRQQGASLLAAVQAQPEDEAGVGKIREAIEAAQQAGPGAEAACGELEDRVHARLLLAAPEDVAAMQAELAAILEARTAWQQVQQAAADREEQGIQLPQAATASPSHTSLASALEEGSGSQGRRSSAIPRRGSVLARSVSSASSQSVASSKHRDSVKMPSRAARQVGKQ